MASNSYPVELNALDISQYRRGNTGIDYVTTFDSGAPGAHVMLSALVHGNELSAAHTLSTTCCARKSGRSTGSSPWPS